MDWFLYDRDFYHESVKAVNDFLKKTLSQGGKYVNTQVAHGHS